MRKLVLLVLTLSIVAVPYASQSAAAGARRYIVVLDRSADPQSVANDHTRAHGAQVSHLYRHAMNGYAAIIPDARIDEVRADPQVAYVSVDRLVTTAAQGLPTGINRIDAEKSNTVSGNGSGSVAVDVAVLDTGIDVDHPDLNVRGGRNCVGGTSWDDGNGHGSHVAGTIGAKDNSSGVVGVAPGARLFALKVLSNSGDGSWSTIICGVDWVTANASVIEVANMSLGGSGVAPAGSGCSTGDALHDAICRSVQAGVTYTVAAGNEAGNAANHVPAAYDEVITVSALADFNGQAGGGASATCTADQDDTFASFSNFGGPIDLIAPGVCIRSTWKGGRYKVISGTSMASPHAAGAAALYKVVNPGATPNQVKAGLQGAGNLNWNDVDDPDAAKETLVNVDAF